MGGEGRKTHQSSVTSLYPDWPLLISWKTGETGLDVDSKVVGPALGPAPAAASAGGLRA